METAISSLLQAKRMIAVINLIAANGRMLCVCVVFRIISAVCVYKVCHVSQVHIALTCVLVSAASAYGGRCMLH